MVTVKCPSCSTLLKLAAAPASGKVKCPKCAAIVSVAAAAAAPSARPAAARPAATKAAPVRPPAASTDPDDENFDFGRINFPTAGPVAAVSHFPVTGRDRVYDGPIPGDPLAMEDPASAGAAGGHGEAAGGGGSSTPSAKAKKAGMSTKAMIRMLIGLTLLIVCSIIAAVVWNQRTSSGSSGDDGLAKLQTSAPEGYRAVGIEGVIVLMPKGHDYDSLPSAIECMAISTDQSQSVFFLGAMDGGSRELDKDQMRKKAERQLGGEILGGQEMERNGYKGIKGILDGSIFLPRMMVEVFHVDERFCILGYAPKSLGADPSETIDRKLESEEEEIFYKSFKVGPKPTGWW